VAFDRNTAEGLISLYGANHDNLEAGFVTDLLRENPEAFFSETAIHQLADLIEGLWDHINELKHLGEP
jgi:hypothetical protein